MNDFPALIMMLAQLSGCVSIICSLPLDDFETRPVPVIQRDLEDLAPLSDGSYISVAGNVPNPSEITRWSVEQDQIVASIPSRPGGSLAPWIIQASDQWWFSNMGIEMKSGMSIYFVRGDRGTSRSSIQFPYVLETWLPLRSSTPSGLAVSLRQDQIGLSSELAVEEVTPEGHKEVATFPWREMSDGQAGTFDRFWSAEALSNGQYALIGMDAAGDTPSLSIRIIDKKLRSLEQRPVQTIPCAVGERPIATALDSQGNLAVIALAPNDSIVATIFDPTKPGDAKCKRIAPPGEFEGLPPRGSPTVRSTPSGFIAAWIRHDGVVRATAIDSDDVAGPIVNVGADAAVREPLRQLLHPDADGVTFIWKDVSGAVKSRRVPLDLRSFAILTEFSRLFCVDDER